MQISSRAVMFWDCCWATRTFTSLQRFSMGLRSGDWLGHSRTLKCFYEATPSLPGRCVWDHCHAERPSHVSSSSPCWWKEVFTQNLMIHGPIHSFLYTDLSSWSLCRKTAPKHVSTPMLHSMYGVLGMQLSILCLPNGEFLPKSYILFSSDHMTFSQSSSGSYKCSLANFRRTWTCTGLSRGTRLALQDLSFCSPFLWSFWPHGVRSCVELSFDSSLVLAIVEFGVWLFEVVDRCLLYW